MSRVSAIVCVFMLVACASGRLPHVPGDPPPGFRDSSLEQAYQDTLEKFTEHGAVYDTLDTRTFFYVTWQSPQFVKARVERDAAFKAVTAADTSVMLKAETARIGDTTEFFFAAHCNDSRYDDFDRLNSMWRMGLSANGQDFKPLSVERVGRTSPELRSIYSYLDSFWVGYRVRFEKVALAPGEKMTVRAASSLGKAEFQFSAP